MPGRGYQTDAKQLAPGKAILIRDDWHTSRQFEIHLFAGVDDREAGKEALGYGLLHYLKRGANQGLGGDDARQGGQNPQGEESPVWQAAPEAGTVILRVLDEVRCLRKGRSSFGTIPTCPLLQICHPSMIQICAWAVGL